MSPGLVNKLLEDFKLVSEGKTINGAIDPSKSENDQSQYLGGDAKTKGVKNVLKKSSSKASEFTNLRGNLML
jgi:hypothetical protein